MASLQRGDARLIGRFADDLHLAVEAGRRQGGGDSVRERTVVPAQRATRAVVYGLLVAFFVGTALVLLAIGGAALFYGDSMITPAISVLSAIEGIGVGTPALSRFVVPLTIVVLVLLFVFQKRGTESVGRFFGPVMLVWFAVIGVDGLIQIAEHPSVLAALNPVHALRIFSGSPLTGFLVLGAVTCIVLLRPEWSPKVATVTARR